ncbi:hypothetical protein NPX13_g2104 [Xylaria arbuscula]|uniref:Uncharacterized protein n=1 Tax=Xylaria arbuscula TaxID=114810 RepID=A0A9W8NKT0_9PEZI|nr:hypothetical protein NPX13_g2104 [Xylaria arbuscula]
MYYDAAYARERWRVCKLMRIVIMDAFIAIPARQPTKSGNVTLANRSRSASTAFSILVRPAKGLYGRLRGRRMVVSQVLE